MKSATELKVKFMDLVSKQGHITEDDFHRVCAGVEDTSTIDQIGDWILQRGFVLKRAVGPQYKQEIMRLVKNPSVENLKDNKNHSHKNKDKLQESKKDVVTKATLNFNSIIEDLQDFEDEFLPAWEKFKASNGRDFDAFKQVLAVRFEYALGAADLQRSIEMILDQFPPDYDVYVLARADGDSVDLGISQLRQTLQSIDDTTFLNEILTALFALKSEDMTTTQPQAEPEQELVLEEGPSIDTASQHDPIEAALEKQASEDGNFVTFSNGCCFKVDLAESTLQKAAGLEVKDTLEKTAGMLFPFSPPENVTFHMGKVKFPIDILFLLEDDHNAQCMRVGKIVENVQPGSDDRWSFQKASAVLELVGGACKEFGIYHDQVCTHGKSKTAGTADPTDQLIHIAEDDAGILSVAIQTVNDMRAEGATPDMQQIIDEMQTTFMESRLWDIHGIDPNAVDWERFTEQIVQWAA